ncbi:hypothetical protein FACUT_1318 [Fusarium acutatum]|uniref:Uncharacterized protein n=1 Tax=Fusarium acutatum TaxID=78861 RepID=A0A8H4K4S7_9HYPO|nr:hypothetical protein FACUT_1318 [Fusarium acutatum]
MRRVLGPKAQDEWLNMSMMIGWCLYRAQAGEFTGLQRPWNATEVEAAGRLIAWGVPPYVLPALLGLPLGEARAGDEEELYRWCKDEWGLLGHQYDPLQEGRFHNDGLSANNRYRNTEGPYSLQENVLGPFGAAIVSGRHGDFGPVRVDDRPQEERSSQAGNSRKRPRETEEDTPEDLCGIGAIFNFGNREQSNCNHGLGEVFTFGSREQRNHTQGEESGSVGNGTEKPYEVEEGGIDP